MTDSDRSTEPAARSRLPPWVFLVLSAVLAVIAVRLAVRGGRDLLGAAGFGLLVHGDLASWAQARSPRPLWARAKVVALLVAFIAVLLWELG